MHRIGCRRLQHKNCSSARNKEKREEVIAYRRYTHKDGCYGQYRFRYIPSHNEYLITYKISVETSRAVVLAGVYEGHA